MYPVKYHKPASIAEALSVLSKGDDPTILAGGQTLLATMKQHLAAPSDLVDIRAISGLSGVWVDGNVITIGATTTHAEVAASAKLARICPALAGLAAGIGDPAVRHLGTIGGSVANNDPAADYPAALLALAATIVTNTREIIADEFFQDLFTTALEDHEIIIAIKINAPAKAAYAKFKQPASLFALVGVFVAETVDGARVAITGAGENGVFRHTALEAALAKEWSGDALNDVVISQDGLLSDLHAAADYRAHLIKVMACRAAAKF